MTTDMAQQLKESDELYNRYVTRLEREHPGEYVAVSPDGKTVLANSLLAVSQKAVAELGPGNWVFKIGERAVGRWR
jgi:hypothetical protein